MFSPASGGPQPNRPGASCSRSYVAGTAALLALLLGNVVSAVAPRADVVIDPLFLALFAMVPLAFLYGLLRSRLARGSVAGLMVALGHGAPLRSALADALGDPARARVLARAG